MSLISAWMLAHAQVVAENDQGVLWQTNEPNAVIQLVERFGCSPIEPVNQQYYCRDADKQIWHIQSLNGRVYAQSFALNQQQVVAKRTWLGKHLLTQVVEHYQIEIFESQQRAQTLVDGFNFRYGARLASSREIEHGRYHITLDKPQTSLLLVQQPTSTHIVQITTRTKSH